MRTLIWLSIILLLTVGTPLVNGQQVHQPEIPASDAKMKLAQANILLALNSDMPDLQGSAALTLRELRKKTSDLDFSNSIIPLMRIVKTEDLDSRTRVAAALALHELRSERGDFAIQRTAEFTDDSYVKHICTWLAVERTREKHQMALAAANE